MPAWLESSRAARAVWGGPDGAPAVLLGYATDRARRVGLARAGLRLHEVDAIAAGEDGLDDGPLPIVQRQAAHAASKRTLRGDAYPRVGPAELSSLAGSLGLEEVGGRVAPVGQLDHVGAREEAIHVAEDLLPVHALRLISGHGDDHVAAG